MFQKLNRYLRKSSLILLPRYKPLSLGALLRSNHRNKSFHVVSDITSTSCLRLSPPDVWYFLLNYVDNPTICHCYFPTVDGTCYNIAAGSRRIDIRIAECPGYSVTDGNTGWHSTRQFTVMEIIPRSEPASTEILSVIFSLRK